MRVVEYYPDSFGYAKVPFSAVTSDVIACRLRLPGVVSGAVSHEVEVDLQV
jgi:copper homeostasis protein CutC